MLRKPGLTATFKRSFVQTSAPFLANTQHLTPTHLNDEPSATTKQRLDRYSSVVLGTYNRPSFILSRGKGLSVWDTQGREYLDFGGGIAVNALGHADEGVARVLEDQSRLLVHSSNLFLNEWAGELACLLVESTKQFGGMGFAPEETVEKGGQEETEEQEIVSPGLKVFFSNSGTEANEAALKFARKWGKHSINKETGLPGKQADNLSEKIEIVSFKNGFHGRTMGALSATWQTKYQAPFAPLVPGFKQAIYNDILSINQAITEKTCGVILEPIQGEGGIVAATEEFLRAVRKRCDEVGAILIFDEIQCGLSRSGNLWAHSDLPVDCHPDIVTMAKPLANGIPIGAVILKDRVAALIKPGDHGTTFGGGPLQTRVGHHVLSRIAQRPFIEKVKSSGAYLTERLKNTALLFPRLIVGPPTGRGLMQGLPMASDEYVSRILKLARERGLLILSCGGGNLRFVPSLIVEKKEIDLCVDILESCLVILNREAEGI